ncbi:MAG: fibronectin type III domain-containing protein [Firmicutes bacterium]|nr:fibronectin type III domain-containing protein [Bacillota bacterium]
MTVKWKKKTGEVSGYQIRYALKSNMKGAKTKNISGYRKSSVKLTKLQSKKKYYIQIRTYKTVKGKKYYSEWSAKKSGKTK